MYLENWIKYQIVYKQVNNENEYRDKKLSLNTKSFIEWCRVSKITISKIICTEKTRNIFTKFFNIVEDKDLNNAIQAITYWSSE